MEKDHAGNIHSDQMPGSGPPWRGLDITLLVTQGT